MSPCVSGQAKSFYHSYPPFVFTNYLYHVHLFSNLRNGCSFQILEFLSKFSTALASTFSQNMLLKSVSLIIQANLGDSVGSVPDHCNKADIAIEQVIRIFWFQCAYLHYMVAYFVYSSIMLKNVHPLI